MLFRAVNKPIIITEQPKIGDAPIEFPCQYKILSVVFFQHMT